MIIHFSMGFLNTVHEADTGKTIENVTLSEQREALGEGDTVLTSGVTNNRLYHTIFLYQIFVLVRQLNLF